MSKIPQYCYESANLGCFSRKPLCSSRKSCCYNNPGVVSKTWDNCPFGKLHKHYKVDIEDEKAKLDKAKKIKEDIVVYLKSKNVNITYSNSYGEISDFEIDEYPHILAQLTKIIKQNL
jgi:hypothetical protein